MMTTEMTVEERDFIEEVYSRLDIFLGACQEYHDKAKSCRAVLLLADTEQDVGKTDPNRKTIQLQTLKSTYNNCVADQMDNMPEALMLPETKRLETVAEDLTDIVRFVLSHNHYEDLHRKRVEDNFATGTSITQIVWDPDMDDGEGNIAVLRWPIESFLWDPKAATLQDARALFKTVRYPMSWFEQHYPDKYKQMGSDDFGSYSQLAKPDAQDGSHVADEETALLLEYWYRLYDADKRRHTINVAYIAGGVLLEKAEDVYKHGMYPFVADVFTPIEGVPVGMGMVEELVPMMRYVNRYASYIDMNLRMASKGRLLVSRNSGIDKDEVADWNTDIIEGDRIDPSAIQWLQTQPFTGMVNQMMLQMQTDMKQDSGQNQFTRGETTGGVTAASAISALQEAGGKITRLRTAELNAGFREIVEQIMWLIAQFYDSKRLVFVTGRSGQEGKEVVADPKKLFDLGARDKGHLPPPPYTVQVQVQRRNPLRQQAQNELFMQAYSMAAQAGASFPLSALFELLHVDGKERVLPVLKEFEMHQQQMQQLAQQNEMLVQENQQLKESVQGLKDLSDQYAAEIGDGEVELGTESPLGGEPPVEGVPAAMNMM